MNLDYLGLPKSWISFPPKVTTFPTKLNPQVRKYWAGAVGLVSSREPRKAWVEAIEELSKQAIKNNLSLFIDRSSANDKILVELTHARRHVVKFMDKYSIANHLQFRSIKRSVRMVQGGFLLTIDSRVDKIDPLMYNKLGLRRASGRREIRLAKNVTFFMYNEGASMEQRWHLGYTVFVDQVPYLIGNSKPTSVDLEKFIIKFYLPILKSYRAMGDFTMF